MQFLDLSKLGIDEKKISRVEIRYIDPESDMAKCLTEYSIYGKGEAVQLSKEKEGTYRPFLIVYDKDLHANVAIYMTTSLTDERIACENEIFPNHMIKAPRSLYSYIGFSNARGVDKDKNSVIDTDRFMFLTTDSYKELENRATAPKDLGFSLSSHIQNAQKVDDFISETENASAFSQVIRSGRTQRWVYSISEDRVKLFNPSAMYVGLFVNACSNFSNENLKLTKEEVKNRGLVAKQAVKAYQDYIRLSSMLTSLQEKDERLFNVVINTIYYNNIINKVNYDRMLNYDILRDENPSLQYKHIGGRPQFVARPMYDALTSKGKEEIRKKYYKRLSKEERLNIELERFNIIPPSIVSGKKTQYGKMRENIITKISELANYINKQRDKKIGQKEIVGMYELEYGLLAKMRNLVSDEWSFSSVSSMRTCLVKSLEENFNRIQKKEPRDKKEISILFKKLDEIEKLAKEAEIEEEKFKKPIMLELNGILEMNESVEVGIANSVEVIMEHLRESSDSKINLSEFGYNKEFFDCLYKESLNKGSLIPQNLMKKHFEMVETKTELGLKNLKKREEEKRKEEEEKRAKEEHRTKQIAQQRKIFSENLGPERLSTFLQFYLKYRDGSLLNVKENGGKVHRLTNSDVEAYRETTKPFAFVDTSKFVVGSTLATQICNELSVFSKIEPQNERNISRLKESLAYFDANEDNPEFRRLFFKDGVFDRLSSSYEMLVASGKISKDTRVDKLKNSEYRMVFENAFKDEEVVNSFLDLDFSANSVMREAFSQMQDVFVSRSELDTARLIKAKKQETLEFLKSLSTIKTQDGENLIEEYKKSCEIAKSLPNFSSLSKIKSIEKLDEEINLMADELKNKKGVNNYQDVDKKLTQVMQELQRVVSFTIKVIPKRDEFLSELDSYEKLYPQILSSTKNGIEETCVCTTNSLLKHCEPKNNSYIDYIQVSSSKLETMFDEEKLKQAYDRIVDECLKDMNFVMKDVDKELVESLVEKVFPKREVLEGDVLKQLSHRKSIDEVVKFYTKKTNELKRVKDESVQFEKSLEEEYKGAITHSFELSRASYIWCFLAKTYIDLLKNTDVSNLEKEFPELVKTMEEAWEKASNNVANSQLESVADFKTQVYKSIYKIIENMPYRTDLSIPVSEFCGEKYIKPNRNELPMRSFTGICGVNAIMEQKFQQDKKEIEYLVTVNNPKVTNVPEDISRFLVTKLKPKMDAVMIPFVKELHRARDNKNLQAVIDFCKESSAKYRMVMSKELVEILGSLSKGRNPRTEKEHETQRESKQQINMLLEVIRNFKRLSKEDQLKQVSEHSEKEVYNVLNYIYESCFVSESGGVE